MLVDGRRLPEATTLSADIAVVGAGAAGITLAKRLMGSGLKVLLIESGGLDYDQDAQNLNAGENVGLPYADLTYNRLRFLGGTTNHWGGWCRPLDAIDFEQRPGVPYSGWPFGREALEPYYAIAQELVEAGPFAYDDEARINEVVGGPIALKGGNLALGLFQYSPPTRFGYRYRDEMRRAADVTVVYNTTLLEIEVADNAGAVTGLRLGCLNGRRLRVRALRYVLAAGGIENARLLLASDSTVAAGLGNGYDLVGRFFMEHPHLAPARLLLTPRDRTVLGLLNEVRRDGLHARPCLRATHKALGASNLNMTATLSLRLELDADGRPLAPDHPDIDDADEAARRSAVARLHRWTQGPAAEGESLPAVEAVMGLASEQTPNPTSRVTLSATRDALGQRRVRLDWRLVPEDLASVRRVLKLWGASLARSGLGHLRLVSPTRDDPWPGAIGWGNHHMGTTRMAADPTRGVVNAQGRVHGIANLYIAGSSVFPTAGAANPTLTIVALAVRLAEHLQEAAL